MPDDETPDDQTSPQGGTSGDPRLEEIQDEVDEIRARVPKNPGMGVPDPDVKPIMPEEEDTNPPM
jgi:hypothetical protein